MIGAARTAPGLRDGLRAGVLALNRTPAEAAVPDADRRARDHQLDDAERQRWSAMRRELAAVAADPDGVAHAAMAAWLAAHLAQLDEPEPGTEVTARRPDRARLRGDAVAVGQRRSPAIGPAANDPQPLWIAWARMRRPPSSDRTSSP